VRYHKVAEGGRGVIALGQTEKGGVGKIGRALPHVCETRIKLSRKKEAGHRHQWQHVGVRFAILSQCAQGIEVVGEQTCPHRRCKAAAKDLIYNRCKRIAAARHAVAELLHVFCVGM